MCSLQTFVFVVEATFVYSLKLTNSFAAEEYNIIMKRVNSLLPFSDPTCVLSVPAENQDFLDFISKELRATNKLMTVEKSFNIIVNGCKNMLFLDVPSSSICDLVREDKRLYLGLNHKLVLCYLQAPADLTTLQSCSSSFGLAVVKVLLQSGHVFVLNSERHFVPEDSPTTINSPAFVTSLQGKRLGVATFNFPPFSIIREKSNGVGKLITDEP